MLTYVGNGNPADGMRRLFTYAGKNATKLRQPLKTVLRIDGLLIAMTIAM